MITDRDYLGLTLCGECRGEEILGQIAVAFVIRNRAEARKQSLEAIVKAPLQFSCWNEDSAEKVYMDSISAIVATSIDKLPSISERQCFLVADGVMDDDIINPISTCVNYVTTGRYEQAQSRRAKEDEWILKLKPFKTIGHHIFLI